MLVIAAGMYVARQAGWLSDGRSTHAPDRAPARNTSSDSPNSTRDTTSLSAAIHDRRSDVVVEAEGVVAKVLPDDTEGDRHQRFLVDLPGSERVLIAHNIDLATRAPLRAGDPVRFKGEFEWNDRGGVVHWTHRDPNGRHAHGWIEIAGRRYE